VVCGDVALFQTGADSANDLFFFVLSILANVVYCTAYLADVPMQYSLFRAAWRQWRWSLWTVGMIFAVVIANYWIADEIYPYVR
jgi:hypothetical protein